MNRRQLLKAAGGVFLAAKSIPLIGDACPPGLPDVRSVPADLITPAVTIGSPRPGQRVRQTLPKFAATAVHHNLYLPTDWQVNRRYPVLVEYPGNGPYTSPCGDFSSGDVDGCNLGYGISAGRSFIWVALPCIAASGQQNQLWWWGDVQATIDYCREAVALVCAQFGGDRESVILCGFSRGAIACNFIGLHDDVIADMWLGFVASSHYDGVEKWDWAGSDRASAQTRLARLKGRASFISQELSTQNIQDYLRSSGVDDPFTFQTIHFRNHTDAWVLRDVPERRTLRLWIEDILRRRPGIHAKRE
jgi:hypothetical protein